MRVELSNYGVQVTTICPGGMRTEMIKEAYGTYTPNEKVKFYLPEELTPAIVEAVAARRREHYTEGFLRILGLVRALFPQSIDNFLDKY
jgi:short-subunit dehydrogenase